MSWSLQIISGDLSLSGPKGYRQVSGPQKLLQDLRNWFLEKQGTDPLHPEFGSTLDGGVSRGVILDSMIGSSITAEVMLRIEAEIRRVLAEYQGQQAERLKNDLLAYGGRHTFDNGELLRSINSVAVRQIGDVVVARVSLTTMSGQTLSLTQPLTQA